MDPTRRKKENMSARQKVSHRKWYTKHRIKRTKTVNTVKKTKTGNPTKQGNIKKGHRKKPKIENR